MNPKPTSAQTFIEAARQAVKNGDRRSAYRYAEQAAALAPQLEEPWLLLAYLASPKAAHYYLDQALLANPASSRALAGKEWLNKQSTQKTQPVRTKMPGSLVVSEQPRVKSPRRHLLRYSIWLGGLVLLVIVLAGLAAMSSAARPADTTQDEALIRAVKTVLQAGSSPTPSRTSTTAPTQTSTTVPTATRTATQTASPVPTGTASPTPTSTASPVPTETASPVPPTAQPSATAAPPTKTPVANVFYSVVFGDTLNLIAQRYNVSIQDLMAANNIPNASLIKAGQVLNIPKPGQVPVVSRPTAAAQTTATSVPTGPSGKGKEILVDISEQHLYAYQDNELKFSFVASTGIGNSTRIGTFKVLDKIPRAYSNAFNIWMPWWMGIYYSGSLENGIHGLPLLMNGIELWGNLLGKPATYGCIESKTSEIKQLYDWAEIGTPVIIRR